MDAKLMRQLQWETGGKPSAWSEPKSWTTMPKFPWVEEKLVDLTRDFATPITVMDVGCFTGYFLRNLVEHYPGKFRGIGVDIQFELMDKLNHMARLSHHPIIFEKRLPKVQVEAITCFDTLEHVSNDRLLLSRMAKRLKSGGKMFIHLPNDSVYDESNDEHLRTYSRRELEQWFEPIHGDHVPWGNTVEAGKDEEGRPTWLVTIEKP